MNMKAGKPCDAGDTYSHTTSLGHGGYGCSVYPPRDTLRIYLRSWVDVKRGRHACERNPELARHATSRQAPLLCHGRVTKPLLNDWPGYIEFQ